MKEANKLTEGALFTAVYTVLLLFFLLIPFILVLLPVPFIVYTKRHDYGPGIVMFIAASIFTFLFATVVTLPVTLLAGIGGIVIGSLLYRGKKSYELLAKGTLGFVISLIIILLILQFVIDIYIYQGSEEFIEQSIAMTESTLQTIQIPLEGDEFSLIEDQLKSLPDLLPASIATTSIFLALATIWISFKVLNRIEQANYRFPPFRSFSLPRSIIWLYIIALFTTIFTMESNETLFIAANNVSILLMILFVIQGFSFVFHYAYVKKWQPAIPYLLLVVSLLIPFLSMIIVRFIGIIDLLIDLKGRVTEVKGN